MVRLLVAVALIAACRGSKPVRKDAGPAGPALAVSALPKLPLSPDGTAELASLDKSIERATDARQRVPLLLQRASMRGHLEDYEDALKLSAALVEQMPTDGDAWNLRVQALLRVHDFTAARAALEKLRTLVHPSRLVDHEIVLADAAGDSERAIVMRADLAKTYPSPTTLTTWAASLAQAGLTDEAIAIIPKAAAAVHDNPAQLIGWLLFQWGRCYELAGQLATARQFYQEAHARLPGYIEATTHLADTMIVAKDMEAARKLVDDALAADRAYAESQIRTQTRTMTGGSGGATPRDPHGGSAGSATPREPPGGSAGSGSTQTAHPHPALLELAATLGHTELLEPARVEWERYVSALPLAFAHHAARFYLGVGHDPARALELARLDQKNRDTREARALVVEAALAAGDPQGACAVVAPLVSAGTRAQRFVAWKALSQCGRTAEADRLGRELGITH